MAARPHRNPEDFRIPDVSLPSTTLIRRIVDSKAFHHGILAVILLAGVLAGLETSEAVMERHGALLRGLDLAVLAVFLAEVALKMAACGRRPWRYFADPWNVFDFSIVAICCLPLESQFSAVFRLVRGLRLLRLVTALPRLQLLVGALLKSLGAMGYVGLLLALMFYVYGVAGVHLFGQAAPQLFGTLPRALLSLFQVITLDNWSDLLSAVQPAGNARAILYFASFILLGTMIMLNLFIGIIMNSMADMHAEMANREQGRVSGKPGPLKPAEELLLLERRLDDFKRQLSRLRGQI